METLVIFVIFIVFSLLRSLGGQGKQPQGRAPGRPGVPPGTPVPRPVPRPVVRPVPTFTTLTQSETRPDGMFKDVVEKPAVLIHKEKEKPKDRARQFVDSPEAVCEEDRRFYRIQVNAESLVQGVVFAEVLGPPRSKKPWQYKH